MSAHQHVAQELSALGQKIGVTLSLDENGVCAIELADDTDVVIVVPKDSEVVTFCATVMPVMMEPRERLLAYLLKLNLRDELTMGAALCLDDEEADIIARYALPADRLRAGHLEQMLASMGELTARLRAHLEVWQREADAGGPSSDDLPPPPVNPADYV